MVLTSGLAGDALLLWVSHINVPSQVRSLGLVSFLSPSTSYSFWDIFEAAGCQPFPDYLARLKYILYPSDIYRVLILYIRRNDLLNYHRQTTTAGHSHAAMVQRCYCYGLDIVLYQART